MSTYYVCILKCSDGSYYTGVTNDIERRIYEHNSEENEKSYTYKRRPVILVYYDSFSNINNAIAYEKQIKGWSRKKKEALINSKLHRLPLQSKNYTQFGKPSGEASTSR